MAFHVGVLEDDPVICGLLKEALEREAYAVSVYHSGWDMIEALLRNEGDIKESKRFDVVLIDLFLPGELSGVQVVHYLHRSSMPLPIVIISAASSQYLEEIQQLYPHIHVVRKPFTLSYLQTTIQISIFLS